MTKRRNRCQGLRAVRSARLTEGAELCWFFRTNSPYPARLHRRRLRSDVRFPGQAARISGAFSPGREDSFERLRHQVIVLPQPVAQAFDPNIAEQMTWYPLPRAGGRHLCQLDRFRPTATYSSAPKLAMCPNSGRFRMARGSPGHGRCVPGVAGADALRKLSRHTVRSRRKTTNAPFETCHFRLEPLHWN